MRTMMRMLCVTLIAALGFVACENKSGDVTAPKVSVKSVLSTENAIIFAVTAEGASECAYLIYDGDVVSVDKIFAEGVAIKGDGNSIVVDGLESDTTYYVVAAAKNSLGATMSETIAIKTKSAGDNGDDNGGDNGDDNGDDNFELPEIDGVENLNIVKTKDGRWYEVYNFYVTFVTDSGDKLILDFYTLDETMSNYLPYGQYLLANSYDPYVLHNESSRYVPLGVEDINGYYFTDGYVSVDVANGYYSIYFMLTYDANGTPKTVQGYYNGILSGASVPEGDNIGAKDLIEVVEVGSTSFKFKINAEPGQYWRCSVVDKRVYDQTASNPGAWVVTYGFMLEGPLTLNWVNGEYCEYVPGYLMNVSSATDYVILAALMDYSEGQENSLLGGVEIVQIRTKAEAAGTATATIKVLEVGRNDATISCLFGDDVWCCYVAMMETANLDDVRELYPEAGYNSFDECMLSLIPGLSHDFMRQFLEPQESYKWEALKYSTSYTICAKVVDMNNGATLIITEPFTTR